MRVAVIGSRGIRSIDFGEVGAEPGDMIVSGGARGVDTLAAEEAAKRGLEVVVFLPDYKTYGRAATFVRNRQIVENCDRLVAFWDGKSRGTASTVKYARLKGKPVKIVETPA